MPYLLKRQGQGRLVNSLPRNNFSIVMAPRFLFSGNADIKEFAGLCLACPEDNPLELGITKINIEVGVLAT